MKWTTEDQEGLDRYIIELSKTHVIRKIAQILHVSHVTLLNRIKKRKLSIHRIRKRSYDWKAIVNHIHDVDFPFYRNVGIYPVELRQLYYRLIELGMITKSQSNYNYLSKVTSEARRGCTSDYLRPSRYGELPIDCIFEKNKPELLGSTDMDKRPVNPTPAEGPEDPEEWIDRQIEDVKDLYSEFNDAYDGLDDIADQYDGSLQSEGSPGKEPGKWYMQENYVELWTEGANLVRTFDLLVGDMVKVTAAGGVATTSTLADNCNRVKAWKDSHDNIEKVIILYCGDLDSTGDWMDEYLVNAIQWYTKWTHHEEFELVRVAVLPEQIEEWDLIEDPEFSTEENGDPRFNRFVEKYPHLVEKYGEKFGIQVEAMLTTDEKIKRFKEYLRDKIMEYWDEELYRENCPSKEYNYEVNNKERPKEIDIDQPYEDGGETDRQMMERKVREFKGSGWESEYD